jgi:hypothetical protein
MSAMNRRSFGVLLALLLAACHEDATIAGAAPDAAAATTTPPVGDAAIAVVEDLAAAPSPPDLGPPDLTINPVALCPVEPMDQLYSGPLPPNPFGALPAAGPCIAAPHDVIILLGCPNNADGTPATCQTTRADDAVKFMQAGYGDQFITSGAAVHNQYVEADTLKQLLIDRGVPATSIVAETRAQHTDENIYYSTRIMESRGWTNAIVISDTPGQLIYEATCDSNCCVDLGRLTVLDFDVGGSTVAEAHYVRYPWAAPMGTAECAQIEMPLKAMCVNLPMRQSCAANFQLPPAVDAGM